MLRRTGGDQKPEGFQLSSVRIRSYDPVKMRLSCLFIGSVLGQTGEFSIKRKPVYTNQKQTNISKNRQASPDFWRTS